MMQTWFECKVKYLKVDDNGKERMVTENFLLDAVSFTDAETRIIAMLQTMVRGEFTVTDIRKSKVAEVFPYEVGEWWYRCTINLVAIDEEAGREKKLRTTYLVQADDIREALDRLEESLSFLIVPYVISAMAVSTIADVFPYQPGVRIEGNTQGLGISQSAGSFPSPVNIPDNANLREDENFLEDEDLPEDADLPADGDEQDV